jgi:beta-glucanase (GH16 family)
MSYRQVFAIFISFLAIALAWEPPVYGGYSRVWASTFQGNADGLPPTSEWNLITGDKNFNNEYQRYTKTKNNLRLSGQGTLQLIPRGDKTAPRGWTSGRVESNYKFTPAAGKITRVQSRLRLAGNAKEHKQGLWPAFWILGNSNRHGTAWPASGELDIMENINGQTVAYGGMHCDKSPGGICNEPSGIVAKTSLADNKYHTWRVEFNRKSSNYKEQYITWSMDGNQFNKITGAQIGNAAVWKTVCQSDLFIILNVAVGGYWPGDPNSQTWGGAGSMMEVAYVAHYVSN